MSNLDRMISLLDQPGPSAGTAAPPAGPDRTTRRAADELRLVVEMGGANLLIRSSDGLDRSCTDALVAAIDAAAEADLTVVLDPAPIRCDDRFAHHAFEAPARSDGAPILPPVAVEAVASGIVRIPLRDGFWTVDVSAGRFSRTDRRIDVRFLDEAAWTPVVAIGVTRARLIALTPDGRQLSALRATSLR